jgi:energy-coupling factor transporter ATP-binding protein EcfA2
VQPAESTGPGQPAEPGQPLEVEPYVRVDARRLESALMALRHAVVSVPLALEAPGAPQARAERRKVLSQIDDYLLPRLRNSGAPILVALVGSTGAGKSTLVNSIVGRQVSATGIRRPTTNSPVLACHPDDVGWFAENVFLPTLPRVRQQGLAMPGRDGLLVLAASEGMPRGVALLDTPDIDSVVQAHRAFAHQFLDASDLWLFMTTARRYADAAVWEMLQDARDRGAALSIVLSRVPPASAPQLLAHFDAMLDANGLHDIQRFVIAETVIKDARLPADVAGPVREWLEDTAQRDDRRVAVLTQTMAGVLDTFRERVPLLADEIRAQRTVRAQLRGEISEAYQAALADLEKATGNGSLVSGEVLARWQEFAGTGDLLRTLQVRRSRGVSRARKKTTPERAVALQAAVQSVLESLVTSLADRAAEEAVSSWQRETPGSALLRGQAGTRGRSAAGPAADLARSSGELSRRAAALVSAWLEHVRHLVQAENVTRRSIARVVTFDEEPLALVVTIGVLGYGAPAESGPADDASTAPQRLLASLFGAGALRDIGSRARTDLRSRVSALFDGEIARFTAVIDAAGVPDETAAIELHQAGYLVEAAR